MSLGLGEPGVFEPDCSFGGLEGSFAGDGVGVLGDCGAEENLELRLDIQDPRLTREGEGCLSFPLFRVVGDEVLGLSGLGRMCMCGLSTWWW